ETLACQQKWPRTLGAGHGDAAAQAHDLANGRHPGTAAANPGGDPRMALGGYRLPSLYRSASLCPVAEGTDQSGPPAAAGRAATAPLRPLRRTQAALRAARSSHRATAPDPRG